jgi:FMN-dependent NADH-azoreductase
MGKLLYIQASPRLERSHSIAVANSFVESFKASHPDEEIVTINLFQAELPQFDGLAVQAKYTILHGLEHTEEERTAWNAVEAIINEFKSADRYVFAVPMWNFHLPYRLKQYLDILIQPGYTFRVTEQGGYEGLVTGKPIFIAYSRGGEYPPGSEAEGFDFQTKYLDSILRFMGFADIRSVVVEPTLAGGPEVAKDRRAAAVIRAEEMAGAF